MGHRKKRGYYSFVSTLFFNKNSEGQIFDINQSWLPFIEDVDTKKNRKQKEMFKKHFNLDIFPALNEKSYTALGAYLEIYASKNDLSTQSNLFRFRPHALDTYENEDEDASISELITRIRDRSLEDRIVIETHNQAESIQVLEELLQIMENALKREGIEIPEEITNMKLRHRVSVILGDNPFLAYVIFKELPSLSILYVSGFVYGVKSIFAFIRPQKEEIVIDNTWISNEHIVTVVAD